jgi:gliding motility-associated-like protein
MGGCSATDDVTITVNQIPPADAGSDQIICNGQSVNLTAYGGISYQWSNGSNNQNTNVSPTVTTTYIVTVTDANGCTDSDDVQVIVNPLPPANAGIDQTICYTTSAMLIASGGISYQWSPASTLSNSTIANPIANPLTTTTYTVTVTDANGCSATNDMTLTVLSQLTAEVNTNLSSLCYGESALLTATPGGGNGNYTYTWDNGIGISTQSVTVTPAQTTMYHVTLTDNCGTPQVMDSVEVIVYPLPSVQFVSDTIRGCQPLSVNFIDNTTPAIATWGWNFGDSASGANNNSSQQNPTHIYNDAGTYTVSLAVTTTNGCSGSDTLNNLIDVYLLPVADFEMDPSTATMENPIIKFIDLSTYPFTWNWDFGDAASGQNNTSILQNPVHIYSDSGTYTILLTVLTDHGCMDTVQKSIEVKEIFAFYVPNAFTPNDDGDNDYFFPKGANWDPNNYEMDIFDRWGNLMYHTNTIGDKWNGTVNNKYSWNDAIIGVYIYLIRVKEMNGPKHEFIGKVTLIE